VKFNQRTLLISCLLIISFIIPCCVGSAPSVQPVQNQVVIFSGQIPFGDGTVSIRSDSGVLSQVPAMTPIGIIQALAGTGMINEYHIGDELFEKRGIFTLDGINSYLVSEYDTWYVTVNGIQLREFLLPAKEGLNTFTLDNGDDVLYAYGDPTLPVGAAKALIWVQIGNKNSMMQYLSPLQIPVSYPVITTPFPTPPATPIPVPVVELTAVPSPVSTEIPAVNVTVMSTPELTPLPIPSPPATPIPVPVVELTAVPSPVSTEIPAVNVTVVSTPELTPLPIPSPPATPIPVPVVELTAVPSPISTEIPAVNVTVVSTPELTPLPTSTPPATPIPVPVVEVNVSQTINETISTDSEIANNTSTSEGIFYDDVTKEDKEQKEDDRIIFSGNYVLPEGTVNVTENTGLEYQISTNTPLGLLHMLLTDNLIETLSIDDRGMRKGGILILEGVNGYFNTASKVWYVKVNGNVLEDYLDSQEGLNIYLLSAGDTVSYYYGNPDEPLQMAEAAIIVALK